MELAVTAHIRHRYTDYDSWMRDMRSSGAQHDLKPRARARFYDQIKAIGDTWRSETRKTARRARGKGKTQPVPPGTDQEKALEAALGNLRLDYKADEAKTRRGKKIEIRKEQQAATLETFEISNAKKTGAKAAEVSNANEAEAIPLSPNLRDGYTFKLTKKQRRDANCQMHLEKLKLDPTYHLADDILLKVLVLHRELGGSTDSLGGHVEAQAQAALEKKKIKKSGLRARRERKHEAAQSLRRQYQLDPTMKLSKQQNIELTRLDEREKNQQRVGLRKRGSPKGKKAKHVKREIAEDEFSQLSGVAKAESSAADSEWMEIS